MSDIPSTERLRELLSRDCGVWLDVVGGRAGDIELEGDSGHTRGTRATELP